jgi:hypothetical protein
MEEADHSFGLLEGLDQAIKQNPIEASIAESDAILVMFEKRRSWEPPSVVRYLEHTPVDASLFYASAATCRRKLSRLAGVAQSARVRAGNLHIYRRVPRQETYGLALQMR